MNIQFIKISCRYDISVYWTCVSRSTTTGMSFLSLFYTPLPICGLVTRSYAPVRLSSMAIQGGGWNRWPRRTRTNPAYTPPAIITAAQLIVTGQRN